MPLEDVMSELDSLIAQKQQPTPAAAPDTAPAAEQQPAPEEQPATSLRLGAASPTAQEIDRLTNASIEDPRGFKKETLTYQRDNPQDDFSWENLKSAMSLGVGGARAGLRQSAAGILRTLPLQFLDPIMKPITGETKDEAVARLSKQANDESADLGQHLEMLGNHPSVKAGYMVESSALQSAPVSFGGATMGGLKMVAALAGLQQFGQTEDEAYDKYLEKGATPTEAFRKSLPPATINGLVTAFLTHYMSGGTEKLALELVQTLKTGIGNTAKMATVKEALKTALKELPKEALHEFPEEALDQLSQGIVAKFTYEPEKTTPEIIWEAITAGLAGIASAGLMGVPQHAIHIVGAAMTDTGKAIDRVNRGTQLAALKEYRNNPDLVDGTGLTQRQQDITNVQKAKATDALVSSIMDFGRQAKQQEQAASTAAAPVTPPVPEAETPAPVPPPVVTPPISDNGNPPAPQGQTAPTVPTPPAPQTQTPPAPTEPTPPAPPTTPVTPPAPVLPPAHTQTKEEYRQRSDATELPTNHWLHQAKHDLDAGDLSKYTGPQLALLAMLNGAPKTGNKTELAADILEKWQLRKALSAATTPSLMQLSGAELHVMLQTAGLSTSIGNKFGKSAQLINWAANTRRKSQQIIADFLHEYRVEQAAKDPATRDSIPEAVRKQYLHLFPESDAGRKPLLDEVVGGDIPVPNSDWHGRPVAGIADGPAPEHSATMAEMRKNFAHDKGVRLVTRWNENRSRFMIAAVRELGIARTLNEALDKLKPTFKKLGIKIHNLTDEEAHAQGYDKSAGVLADIFDYDRNDLLVHLPTLQGHADKIANGHEWVESLVEHEFIHFAQKAVLKQLFDQTGQDKSHFANFAVDHYQQIFNEMTPEQVSSILSSYLGREVTPATTPEALKSMPNGAAGAALEFVRQIIQVDRTKTTDEAIAQGEAGPKLVEFLKQVRDMLKSMWKQATGEGQVQLRAAVQNIENFLRKVDGKPPETAPTEQNSEDDSDWNELKPSRGDKFVLAGAHHIPGVTLKPGTVVTFFGEKDLHGRAFLMEYDGGGKFLLRPSDFNLLIPQGNPVLRHGPYRLTEEFNVGGTVIPKGTWLQYIGIRPDGTYYFKWRSDENKQKFGDGYDGIAIPASKVGLFDAVEPWKYTSDEWASIGEDDQKRKAGKKADQAYYQHKLKAHRKEVEKAANDGKPVPPEVLAEYPDISNQPPPTTKPAARPLPALEIANAIKDKLVMGQEITRKDIDAAIGDKGVDKKQADEWAELGIVMAARQVVQDMRKAGKSDTEIFRAMVDIYNRQPVLSAKTSTSKINQAYSTPAPIAFVADVLADVENGKEFNEPTAGNGMLMIGVTKPKIHANEIDPKRVLRLKTLEQGEVTSQDATVPPAYEWDRSVMNPPFGRVLDDSGNFRVYKLLGLPAGSEVETTSIDHAIVMAQLTKMTPDGKATLIIGAPKVAESGGSISTKYRQDFYHFLYELYNVVDHFTISGDLYKKQGAGWPIDVIVINGKGKSALPRPSKVAPVLLKSWNELEAKLQPAGEKPAATSNATESNPTGTGGPVVGGSEGVGDSGNASGTTGQVKPAIRTAAEEGGSEHGGLSATASTSTTPGSGGTGPGVSEGVAQKPAENETGGVGGGGGTAPGGPSAPNPGGLSADKKAKLAEIQARNKAKIDLIKAELEKGNAKPAPAASPGGLRLTAQPASGPSVLSKEARMAALELTEELLTGGLNNFEDYLGAMVDTFGEAIVPYAKGYYEYSRSAPETAGIELTPSEGVIAHLAQREQASQPSPTEPTGAAGEDQTKPASTSTTAPTQVNPPAVTPPAPTANTTTAPVTQPTPVNPPVNLEEDGTQVPYVPVSKLNSGGFMVPRNIATYIQNSLKTLEHEVGLPIDKYVADRLKYGAGEDIGKYFFAEQVEAIAATIFNIENGSSYIVGDMTGCIAAGTSILNPITGQSTPVEVLAARKQSHTVLSMTPEGLKPHLAEAPFLKGKAKLFRVTTEAGQQVVVTERHRFLSSEGWIAIGDGLKPGHFLASVAGPLACNSESGQSAHIVGAPHSLRRVEDCLDRYCSDLYLGGAPLPLAQGSDRLKLPLPTGAHAHTQQPCGADGQGISEGRSRQHPRSCRPSKNNFSPSVSHGHALNVALTGSSSLKSLPPLPQAAPLSGAWSASDQSIAAAQTYQSSPHSACSAELLPRFLGELLRSPASTTSLRGKCLPCISRKAAACPALAGSQPQFAAEPSLQEAESGVFECSSIHRGGWDRVLAMEFVGFGEFYDLRVPGPENYVAAGLVHHNSGKGRVAAAIQRYAVLTGRIPVFITATNGLYSAMLTDLKDIGSEHLVPMFTNNNFHFTDELKRKWSNTSQELAMAQLAKDGTLPPGVDMIYTTYPQVLTDAPKKYHEDDKAKAKRKRDNENGKLQARPDGARMKALRAIAPNAIFILDESHMAAGKGSDVGIRLSQLLQQSKGAYYSSATFAKNPASMPLYFKTKMGEAGLSPAQLIEVMSKGGFPLQQALTAMLADDGQYTRRESDYKGILFQTEVAKSTAARDAALNDEYMGIVSEVVRFGRKVLDWIEHNQPDSGDSSGGASEEGFTGNNFASQLFVVARQYLLALKAESVAQKAIEEAQKGNKPVIMLENTMEGPLDDIKTMGFSLDFRGVLQRYMQKIVTVKERKPGEAKKVERNILKDLPAELQQDFEDLTKTVLAAEIGDMPLSPVDHIKKRIEETMVNGKYLKMGELTGRKQGIDYKTGKTYNRTNGERSTDAKLETMAGFNGGSIDAVLFNAAAATGFSIHAASKFNDKRKRVGIIMQVPLDINTFMQQLGRINRKGQVVLPEYYMLMTDLPAERRPMVMAMNRLAGLNATTTSNTDSDVAGMAESTPDMLNHHGDTAVYRALQEHPDIVTALDDLFSSMDSVKEKYDNAEAGDFYSKVTGNLVTLLKQDQEKFWESAIAHYKAIIDSLNESGENDLIAKAEDFNAETLDKQAIYEGAGTSNFSGPAFLERVKVKAQKKPLTVPEITQIADANRAKAEQDLPIYLAELKKAEDRQIAAQASRSKENWTPEKEAKARAKFMEIESQARLAVEMMGEPAKYTTRSEDIRYGMVSNVEFNLEKPERLSEQKVTVHMNTSQQKAKLPLSQMEESVKRLMVSPQDFESTYTSTAESSDERMIVTGNLLGGFQALHDMGYRGGKVINYTTNDGQLKTGILLSGAFDAGTVVPITTADDLLHAVQSPDAGGMGKTVTSTEGVTIRYKVRGDLPAGIYLYVPESKSRGGKFWQDRRLGQMLEAGEFVKSGSQMIGQIKPAYIDELFKDLTTRLGQKLSYMEKSEKKPELGAAPQQQSPQQQAATLQSSRSAVLPSQPASSKAQWSVSVDPPSNTVRVRFTEKPARAVLDSLKARGYRWNRYNDQTWTSTLPKGALPTEKDVVSNLLETSMGPASPKPQPAAALTRRQVANTVSIENARGNTLQAQAELESASAQNHSLVSVFSTVGARIGADPVTISRLGVGRASRVMSEVARLQPGFVPVDYHAVMSSTMPESLKNMVTKDMLNILRHYELHFENVNRQRLAQEERVTSMTFLRRVVRMQSLDRQAKSLDSAVKSFQSQMSAGIAKAQAILADAKASTATIQHAQAEYDYFQKMMQYPEAIRQRARDVVDTLLKDTQGQQLLLGSGYLATGLDLLTRYNELKDDMLKTNPNLPAMAGWIPHRGRNEEALTKATTDMLARAESVRRDLVGAYFPASLNQSLSAVEKQLLDGLRVDAGKTLDRVLTESKDLTTEHGRVMALWSMVNKEVMAQMARLDTLQKQTRLANEVQRSVEWRVLRNTVNQNAGRVIVQPARLQFEPSDQNMRPNIDELSYREWMPMPDGTVLDLDLRPGSLATQRVAMEQGMQRLESWLTDPANMEQRDSAGNAIPNSENPYMPFWEMTHKRLNSIYATSLVTGNFVEAKDRSLWTAGMTSAYHGGWGMLSIMLKQAQIPAGRIANIAANNWKQAFERSSAWIKVESRNIDQALIDASRAHDFHRDNVAGDSVFQWYQEVGNELFWSAQETGRTRAVGDQLGSGRRVTREDIRALRVMHDAVQNLIQANMRIGREGVMEESLIEEGRGVWRRAIEMGDRMLPRTFDETRGPLVTQFHNIGMEGRPGDQTVRRWTEHNLNAQQRMTDLLNGEWFHDFMYAFAADRNPDFSRAHPWESVYADLAQAMRDDMELRRLDPGAAPLGPRSMQEVFDFIESRTPTTIPRQDIESGVMDQAIRQMENVYKQAFEGSLAKPELQHQRNSFTAPREHRLASFFFYRHGFNSTPAVVGFGMDSASYWFERMLWSLEGRANRGGLINALQDELDVRDRQRQQLQQQVGQSLTESRHEADRANIAYQNYESLMNQLKVYTQTMKTEYSSGGKVAREEFQTAQRLFGSMTGLALASVNALANVHGSTLLMGQLLSAQMNNSLFGYGVAVKSTVQELIATALPATARLIGYSARNAVLAPAAFARTPGNIRVKTAAALRQLTEDVSDHIFEHSRFYRDMQRLGYHNPEPLALTLSNRIMLGSTGGKVYEMRALSRNPLLKPVTDFFWGAVVNGLEIPVDMVRAVFPRAFDMTANIMTMRTAANMAQILENQLRRTYAEAPAGRFDLVNFSNPANELLPSELVPSGFMRLLNGVLPSTTNNTKELIEWFTSAGIPLTETVMDFFHRLQATPRDQWNTVRFLPNPDQISQLGVVYMEAINKGTPLNRPILFKTNALARLASTFYGFWVHALRKQLNVFGPAMADPQTSRVVLKTLAALGFITSVGMLGGVGYGYIDEELRRWLYKIFYNEDRAFRLPHESTSDSDKARNTLALYLSSMPLVAQFASTFVSNQPNRPGVGMTAFAQNRVNDLANYFVGALKSGDPTYRLPQLLSAIMPLGKVVLDRLPGYEGTIEGRNATRLLQRGADDDLVRRSMGGAGSGNVTPLTPYGDKIVNAIMRGDLVEADRLKAKAIEVATEMGVKDPEKTVKQMIESRNPVTRAFRVKPTDEQLAETLSRLSPEEAQQVQDSLAKFQTGARAMGATANLVAGESTGAGAGAGSSTSTGSSKDSSVAGSGIAGSARASTSFRLGGGRKAGGMRLGGGLRSSGRSGGIGNLRLGGKRSPSLPRGKVSSGGLRLKRR